MIIKAIKLSILSLIFIFPTYIIKANDTVTVDFTAAEKTLEWLKYVNTNPDYDKIKTYFMTYVVPTPGVQSIIHHWSRFKTWNNDEYFKFIMLALDMLPESEKLSFELPDYFEVNKKLWQKALVNPDRISGEIQDLKNLKLDINAIKKAHENLPEEISLEVDFYFVLFGASTAFAVGKENGMDMLQLPRTIKGTLNLDAVSRTISHEMHHNGFSIANSEYMPCEVRKGGITLMGVMAAEGTATYFNQQPYQRFLDDRELNKGIDLEVRVWQEKIPKLPELLLRAENDLMASVTDNYEQKNIYPQWLSGYTGDAYIVGTMMIRLIDQELGHSFAMDVIRDYRKFVVLYNKAAKKANGKGQSHYLFSDKLALAMQYYQGKFN